jgi:hypothetical protein
MLEEIAPLVQKLWGSSVGGRGQYYLPVASFEFSAIWLGCRKDAIFKPIEITGKILAENI